MKISPFLEPIASEFLRASDEEIRKIEELIGSPLPPPYISFLKKYGGACFNGEASVLAQDDRELGVFVLYAASGERYSVLSDLSAHASFLSDGYIPVADDLFNNRYVLAARTGKVLFIEYGHGTNRTYEVAPSFDAFCENIRVIADEAL